MFKITFPLLKRFVQFTFIVSLVTAFSALFSLIYVMTGGGPVRDNDARVLLVPAGLLGGRLSASERLRASSCFAAVFAVSMVPAAAVAERRLR